MLEWDIKYSFTVWLWIPKNNGSLSGRIAEAHLLRKSVDLSFITQSALALCPTLTILRHISGAVREVPAVVVVEGQGAVLAIARVFLFSVANKPGNVQMCCYVIFTSSSLMCVTEPVWLYALPCWFASDTTRLQAPCSPFKGFLCSCL